MIKVAISGHFNPLHVGHIRYIKEAKKLGDKLVVIVNSDYQVALKRSWPFMEEQERVSIIKAIKYVDEVVLSIDKDRTVCKTLKKIKPDIYAVGGDHYKRENIPESKLGIKVVYGVGGVKVQSSSSLIKKCKKSS
jgi:cytidyltransferase-like protein